MTPEDLLRHADAELEQAEKLLTVSVAARRLSVCHATIRRWIKSGKLPATRYPSGQFRVSEIAILKIQTTSIDIC